MQGHHGPAFLMIQGESVGLGLTKAIADLKRLSMNRLRGRNSVIQLETFPVDFHGIRGVTSTISERNL